MENNDSENLTNEWKLPHFCFKTDIGFGPISFQDVSGLDTENEFIEYRHENTPEFSRIKMPGLKKTGTISLKKGRIRTSNEFWTWLSQVKEGLVKSQSIEIVLVDDANAPVNSWAFENARAIKVTGLDLNPNGDEGSIESIELTHEGIISK
ncbi:MAG: phage tail protein [Bacteroidales bacterium]|nr:phage tail protein [Bacteroidales bacterium]